MGGNRETSPRNQQYPTYAGVISRNASPVNGVRPTYIGKRFKRGFQNLNHGPRNNVDLYNWNLGNTDNREFQLGSVYRDNASMQTKTYNTRDRHENIPI